MNPVSKLFAVGALALLAACPTVHASLLYLYDFPGDPGSGLAADQTNPQPTGATFGDFTRNNVGVVSGSNNEFGSNNWSLGGHLIQMCSKVSQSLRLEDFI
jgi:hypothetical protein